MEDGRLCQARVSFHTTVFHTSMCCLNIDSNILRIKSTEDGRKNNSEEDMDHLIIPDATPRMEFVARYEFDVKMLYLNPAPFKAWCVSKQIPYEGLMDMLRSGGTRARMVKKRMYKGTRFTALGSTQVISIDCAGFMGDETPEESTETT